jgi:hypothetical protein
MYKYTQIILFLLLSCGTPKKFSDYHKNGPARPQTCQLKLQKKYKVEGRFTGTSFYQSILKSYNRKLYENLIHAVVNYEYNGDNRSFEIRRNDRRNTFDIITSINRNELESKFPKSTKDYYKVLSLMPNFKFGYKQSYYYLGNKKLQLIYDNNKLIRVYLGKDFSCRFDQFKPQCQCSRWMK